jgi:hypothetical protein
VADRTASFPPFSKACTQLYGYIPEKRSLPAA